MGRKALVVKTTEKQLNKFEKNYASDPAVCDRFLEYYRPRIQDARTNRLEMEDQWIDDLRLWSCRLDDMGYVGRSNIFVPELHSQIELSVDKAMSALFPGPDIVKAIGINGTPQEKADKIRAAVEYELSEKIQLFVKHEQFERNKILFGTSVYKTGFRKELKDIYTRNEKGQPIKDQVPKYFGATCDLVDIFRWYIYPETGNLLDHEFIFEDQWYPRYELENNPDYINLDQVSEKSFDPHHQWVDAERLEIVNISSASSVRKGYIFLTEVWTEFALEGKERVPCRAVIANDGTVLHLGRNRFWHQSHPYLAERYIKRPGNLFYGFSLPDKLRSTQYQINDVTNHTMDSLQYSLSPVTVVDPGLVGDVNSMKFMPGARWFGSPEGIKPMVFPDVSISGLRMVQELRGQFAQFSDTQPGVAPQLQGKVRSATQASIINQNVTSGQRINAKSEEISVFSQLCRHVHSNLKQFMDQDWQIKYQGPINGEWIVENITPSDIWGEAEWVWLGASAAEKTALRSQQLLAFQQQALQAAQIIGPDEIDLPLLLKMIAAEALELKGMDDLFKSLRKKKTVDPEVENRALLMGRDVYINYGDDDDYHIRVVSELINDKSVPEEIRLKAIAHRTAHEQQKFAKQEMEKMQDEIKMQQMQQQMPQAGLKKDGREGIAVPSPMEGNKGQTSADLGSVLTGVRGAP
jgi:hypothetical protein